MSRALQNKPLAEAIFELRWALEAVAGRQVDPYYPIMLGEFFAAVKERYPYWEPLVPPGMPVELAPQGVHHRFRAAAGQWPLVQLGPGIMTVNDTEGYQWEGFQKICMEMVETLIGLYSSQKRDFSPALISLRYIDAQALHGVPVTEFLTKLKLKLEPGATLFDSGWIQGPETKHLALALSYESVKPKGVFTARFNQGETDSQPGLIWDTQILSSGDDLPVGQGEIEQWLHAAHATTSDWFFRQIEGELLEAYQ